MVVDTNLWVSMAIGSRAVSEQMAQLVEHTDIEIFVSTELLDELTETLGKPRLQRYLTHERTKRLFELIWMKTQLINVTTAMKVCRDPKDDFVVNLAVDANAHYIITGDADLLVLNPFGAITILSLGDFLQSVA